MVDRDIRYYMKMRKLRKQMKKIMKLPYSAAVEEKRLAILLRIRMVEDGAL